MRPETSPDQTPTRLGDYTPPDWLVEHVRLVFDLAPSATRVRSTIRFRRNGRGPADLADRVPGADAHLRGERGGGLLAHRRGLSAGSSGTYDQYTHLAPPRNCSLSSAIISSSR